MKKSQGFTLIELMITVAIVAILAAVAYPAYLDSVRKGHRADAKSLLMTIGSRQQQTLLDVRSYASDLGNPGGGVVGLNMLPLPASVTNFYSITLATGTGTVPSFTATATPIPTKDQANDKCGTLSLNQAGVKTASGTAPNCW